MAYKWTPKLIVIYIYNNTGPKNPSDVMYFLPIHKLLVNFTEVFRQSQLASHWT